MGHGRCQHVRSHIYHQCLQTFKSCLHGVGLVWSWFGGQSTFGYTFPLLDLTKTLGFPHITCLGLSLSKLRMQCKAMVDVMTINLAMSTRLDGVGIVGGRLKGDNPFCDAAHHISNIYILFPTQWCQRGFGVSLLKPIVTIFTSIMFSLMHSKTWNT